jgi:hypothetical protein
MTESYTPPRFIVKALTPNVTTFGGRAFKEASKIK